MTKQLDEGYSRSVSKSQRAGKLELRDFSAYVGPLPVRLVGCRVSSRLDQSPVPCFLAQDERDRAFRMKSPLARTYFITGRVALRIVLSEFLGVEPQYLVFETGSFGKPRLGNFCGSPVSFNMSHAGEWVLVAVSQEGEVGVDVEPLEERRFIYHLVRELFSAEDYRYFCEASGERRVERFYQLWCRREATLKAFGKGARYGTLAVQWSTYSAHINDLTWSPADVTAPYRTCLVNLECLPNHTAALVLVTSLIRTGAVSD